MKNVPLAGRLNCARPEGRPARLAPSSGFALLCLIFVCTVAAGTEAGSERPSKSFQSRGARSHAPSSQSSVPLTSFSLPSISSSDYWLRLDTGLQVSRESLDTRWHSLVSAPGAESDYSLSSPEAADRWNRMTRGLASIEFEPTHLLASDPQRDYRPHFELGSSSDSLRTWLRGAGLNASTCMAPLMRMHSTVAGTGPRTNVSVSARCSFH
jgi:hypothetical protein